MDHCFRVWLVSTLLFVALILTGLGIAGRMFRFSAFVFARSRARARCGAAPHGGVRRDAARSDAWRGGANFNGPWFCGADVSFQRFCFCAIAGAGAGAVRRGASRRGAARRGAE